MTSGLQNSPTRAITLNYCGENVALDRSGALYLSHGEVLVFSDLHLEKGSSFATKRRFLPPYDTLDTLNRMAEVISRYRPRMVISLGDSFHDGRASARMPDQYRLRLREILDGCAVYWVAGNHDPLPPEGITGDCVEEIRVGPFLFRHLPTPDVEGEIAGHLHPCARIAVRGQSIRRPCFASDGQRLIMPAFGSFTGSLNVLDEAFHGLFAMGKLTAFMLGRSTIHAVAQARLRP